jgi:hypothetical protein
MQAALDRKITARGLNVFAALQTAQCLGSARALACLLRHPRRDRFGFAEFRQAIARRGAIMERRVEAMRAQLSLAAE